MREYVIVLPKKNPRTSFPDSILLVRKDKPEWQKGRLNLVGGKIEPGETPIEAATRELKEEAGLDGENMRICGKMIGSAGDTIDGEDWIVWCLRCDLLLEMDLKPRVGETEEVDWFVGPLSKLWKIGSLMPNLKVIIPLLLNDVKGWTMTDQTTELKFPYNLTLELSE